MSKRYALSDVSPTAITICKQGANRQKVFLRKSGPLLELPAGEHRILKAKAGDDWSVFYTVVAEPGAEEDPGLVGEEGSVDVWADETEIRKAAHRLLKNKAYVNAMHDALEEEGCHIVENAVAFADIEIEGPDDESTVIRKGSWYIGIEPSEAFKGLVDSGEITGVSLEGDGLRTEIAKADPKAQGTKGKDRAPASSYRKCPSCDGKVAVGVKSCPNCSTSLKKSATFNEVIVEREFQDSLWRTWNTLEGVIWDAFRDEEESDPKSVITTSIGQFQDFLLAKLDAVPASERGALAKELCSLHGTTDEEDEMGLTEDIAALRKTTEDGLGDLRKETDSNTEAVKGLVSITQTLVQREVARDKTETDGGEGEQKTLKKEDAVKGLGALADKMDEIDAGMTALAKSVAALGEGGSAQGGEADTTPVKKSDNPLAGLLS